MRIGKEIRPEMKIGAKTKFLMRVGTEIESLKIKVIIYDKLECISPICM